VHVLLELTLALDVRSQWLNPTKASITLGTGSETKTLDVEGYAFVEASFISE